MRFPHMRDSAFTKACLLLLAICLSLGGCDSGGGGGDDEPFEFLSWSRLRGDILNSGRAVGAIANNPGRIEVVADLSDLGVTASTPAMGIEDVLYIGTARGLVAIDPYAADGNPRRWVFERCDSVEVGPIDGSPAITAEGDVVVGTNNGRVFRVSEDEETGEPTCHWLYPRRGEDPIAGPILSSPALRIDPVNLDPGSTFFTADAGFVQALNRDGSARWRFPPAPGALVGWNSSPAIANSGVLYATAPDGNLYALELSGRVLWQRPAMAASHKGLLASPAVNQAVYVPEQNQAVTAFHSDGQTKWRSETLPRPIAGSLAFASQSIQLGTPEPTVTPTPVETTTPPAETPVPTSTPRRAVELLVYAADTGGSVHAIRDINGRIYRTLRFDGDDSTVPVSGSPIVSGDLYVVLSGDDGFVYASDLDGGRPCTTPTIAEGVTPTPTPTGRIPCTDSNWEDTPGGTGGRVSIGSAIRSFIIAQDGTIFVTAADGTLYSMPVPNETTVVPTPTPSPTPTPEATGTSALSADG